MVWVCVACKAKALSLRKLRLLVKITDDKKKENLSSVAKIHDKKKDNFYVFNKYVTKRS